MERLKAIWDAVKHFFVENKDWFGDFASVAVLVTIIVGGLWAVFKFIFEHRSLGQEAKDARQYFENMGLRTKEQIEREPTFFDEPSEQKYFFYKNMPISSDRKAFKVKSLLDKAYILTGPAGCGKSTLLKYDFIKNFSKKNIGKKVHLFFNSVELISLLDDTTMQDELKNKLMATKYKQVILYLDGVDEIGESRAKRLSEFVDCIIIVAKKVDLKITSRPDFAQKYILRNNSFMRIKKRNVQIMSWSSKMLNNYAANLLKTLNNIQYDSYNKISDIKNQILNDTSWLKNINSPLLMKLFVYMKLQTHPSVSINTNNKFDFYDNFISCLIKTYCRRNNDPITKVDLDKIGEEIAEAVFAFFSSDKKQFSLPVEIHFISTILKKTSGDKLTFTHETFFEYFVAKHYLLQTRNNQIDKKALSIFYQNYSNDYADFITDAINTNDNTIKEYFFEKLCSIYYYTLDENTKEELKKYFEFPNNKFICEFPVLNPMEFFSLKYEIVFRLGRLGLQNPAVVDFLEFIYWNDSNIKQTSDLDYYSVVLKRCCAISSSFLAGENIELDYVERMLPFLNNTYNANYDLANRSHTLIFYGDVIGKTIYNFKDDDKCISCHNAFDKRITRLSKKLPTDISKMDGKTKKQYFFRLFDLATIYTFMYNRSKRLSFKEKRIVSKCFITFNGASQKRLECMFLIKKEILSLNKQFKLSNRR